MPKSTRNCEQRSPAKPGVSKLLERALGELGRAYGEIKPALALAMVTCGMICIATIPARATETDLDQMPVELEMRFALSALPPALRDNATVYLLDPMKGYELSRQGASGVTCLVQRTAWEMADFRNDIYIPLCYDEVGAETYVKVMLDTAVMRAEGMDPAELRREIKRRFVEGTYRAPDKPGMSYMLAPVQRTIGPPNLEVVTLSLPHFMPYAPNTTNDDIGAELDLGNPSTLANPFIERQGVDEQSYMILLVGEERKAEILVGEKSLLEDLCAYRDVLCLPGAAD